MSTTYIHMLGDSTIDNLYWVIGGSSTIDEAQEKTVVGKLQKRLGDSYKVNNLSYDGFTTSSLLHGDTVGRVLPSGWVKQAYLQRSCPDGVKVVYPLKALNEAVKKEPDSVHYVVLSVGGNDFRENLLLPWRLFTQISNIQERYLQIVQEIRGMESKNIRPIFMFQYRTDAKDDPYKIYTILGVAGKIAAIINIVSLAVIATFATLFVAGVVTGTAAAIAAVAGAIFFYGSQKIVPLKMTFQILFGKAAGIAMIGSLMQKFYQPMLKEAISSRLPILDLPNTFNPNASLYTCGIEPNEAGSELIAEGLAHIIIKHDFASGSACYAKSAGAYEASLNLDSSAWRVEARD